VWVDAHTFRLGARLSTIFELRVGGTLLPGETQDQALLGHVVLRVPPVRQANHVISTVQGANPVRVLLSASRFDTRDAFNNLARNLDGVTQLQLSGNDIFSSQSIPISTGRAENEIEPEGLRVKDVVGATARLRDLGREGKITRGALLMSEEDRFPALVDLLAGLSADESGLAALNDLLAEVSADVRVRPQ
jgi:hypothetical protein